jgi:outer membrane protein TolC
LIRHSSFVLRHSPPLLLLLAAACTVHPRGELQERKAAIAAGAPYRRPVDKRALPPLPADPTPDDLVRHALLANADLEAKYWEWRAALEQVPQEGTQKSGLELSFESMIMNGATALESTTLALGNDAMNSLMLPSKLGTMAAMALHDAQAAGLRFDKARFELRNTVLAAWYDYALAAELARLDDQNTRLLDTMARVTESRLATGTATQADLLRAANEVEMSRNEAAMRRARFPDYRATLDALLNRPADATPLPVPAALPPLPAAQDVPLADADLLARIADRNPELQALAHEIAGKKDALRRARLEYLPDFNLNVGTDLAGMSQSLMGSVVVPYLRHEAIDAGVRQAVANLRAAEAMQRQTRHDLAARALADLAMLRDADRQIALLDATLLPRARQIIDAAQSAYATGGRGAPAPAGGMGGSGAGGGAGLLDLLDTQRALLALQRMRAELQITRLKQHADLEALSAHPLP